MLQGLCQTLRHSGTQLAFASVAVAQACVAPQGGAARHTPAPLTSAAPATLTAVSELDCAETLQSLVDAAATGATLIVPACIYRETVRITRPMTLVGQPGAEIRGSDIWSAWASEGTTWISTDVLPDLPVKAAPSHCRANTRPRCLRPEQVFLDGHPLELVASRPTPGQFAVDDQRHIVLGDPPEERLVEVTTRRQWVSTVADDVTIRRLTMQHAANDAESGAIGNQGHLGWALEDSVLSDAHGAVVFIGGGSDVRVLRNDVSRGGQIGIASSSTDGGVLVQGNRIHDNNTAGFDWNWEAGGLKMVRQTNLTLDGNEVWGNQGHGLWCDILCQGATISGNRVYQNRVNGIFFEVSSRASIVNNDVWENGGGGIVISTSSGARVSNNVLAWNGRGIVVLDEQRSDRPAVGVRDNHVQANTVIMGPGRRNVEAYALAWLQPGGGTLFDSSTTNDGDGNAFWLDHSEDPVRFSWAGRSYHQVVDFSATTGGIASRELTAVEKDQVLSERSMPTARND
jgi:parallel beta-helix repeat protein